MSDPALDHLRADPVMAALIDRGGPFRLQPAIELSHFESIARSIVYQQLSGKAAATIYGRVRALFDGAGPTPAAVAALEAADLQEAGLSRQKASYLLDFASRCLAGDVRVDILHTLEDDEVIRELTRVRGIGVWTAQMFLIFRLGRPDVLPDLDLGVQKAIQAAYGLSSLPSPQQVREIGGRWKPYCSYAAWYLWRSLEPASESESGGG